jgi:splicing factor 45
MTLADWTAEGEDEDHYEHSRERRREQNQQRKRQRKRKKQGDREPTPQDWDDIYDPTRPNNYEEYMQSEERVREIREWKDRLHAHQMGNSSDFSSDEERPQRGWFCEFVQTRLICYRVCSTFVV